MSKRNAFILLIFLSIILISSCRDANINPYEEDTGIYSIYGAVDMDKTEHVIRVKDLRVSHQNNNSINLDAKVTFFDLAEGTSQILRDSIVQFSVNYTHNFILKKELIPRSSYKIEVERSDGSSVASYCTTPGITETYIFPFFGPYSCNRELEFVFRNVLPEEQIRFEVGVKYEGEMHWQEVTNLCRQEYSTEYNELKVIASTNNFLNVIFPKVGASERCSGDPPRVSCFSLNTKEELNSDEELNYKEIVIRYFHLGPEWNRVFPDRPVDPVNVDDVENGLGFFGAYRSGTHTYLVDP